MKSKYLIGAFAIAAAGLALPASAQMSTPSWSSVYLGASLGSADLDADCGGVVSCDTKDSSWRVFAGYQFNRHFAAELGYANLGEANFDFGPGDRITAEATAFDLSAVGMLPVGPVSIYGRLGLYRATVDIEDTLFGSSDNSNNGLLWGIGVQYDFTRNLAVRAEWQQYMDVEDDVGTEFDIKVLNIGVLWRFQ
jgi:OOP family OmpA-OmpF porin